MGELLEMLKKNNNEVKLFYEPCKALFYEDEANYKIIIKSPKISKEHKLIARHKHISDITNLERLSSELVLSNFLEILTLTVENVNFKIDETIKQLIESGVFDKAKEMGNIAELKKKLNETATIFKEISEVRKKMKKRCENDPTYIS